MESVPVLAQVPLFAGLSTGELEALEASMRRRRYPRGEFIFRQEDPGATCYIVEAGRVKIAITSPDGRQITLALLGPGDLFGEMALLDGEPRSADALAAEPSQLLMLHQNALLDFLRSHPETSLKLLAALAQRLRRTDQLLQDLVFLNVPGRVAKVILELAESQEPPAPGGKMVTPRLTQGELAALVGTTRESVNKWLGFYQDRGLLSYGEGKVIIHRPQELRHHIC